MALSSAFLVLMVYTAEAYPTLTKNFAYGFNNAFTRLGGAITPTIGQVLLDHTSSVVTFSVYAAGCLVSALLTALLPFDTLGRDPDTGEVAARKGKGNLAEETPPPTEITPLQQKRS